MKFSVLGSGSRGNCVYIEEGKTRILIDNGFSGKEIEKRLKAIGRSLENISAICITHEHNDHIAGVGVLSRRCKIPIFSNPGTFKGAEKKVGKLHRLVEFETGDEIGINDIQVRSFRVSHDTEDPVGYVVSNGSEYLGYCTDTGKVSKLMELRLAGCHGLILEFNHNLEMLKNGPYPLVLQQRVRSSQGHLANEDAADFLKKLMHRNLQVAVLAHLSETNNSPELAFAAADPCFSSEYEAKLMLAKQDSPTELVVLRR
jgi:phosphoribosyl 1,2-cyclic phosphodiesterase